jgi:hypothetical protein
MGWTAQVRMRQGEATFLASYLPVLQEWDARVSVRMQQRDSVIGVYGSPPGGLSRSRRGPEHADSARTAPTGTTRPLHLRNVAGYVNRQLDQRCQQCA